MTSRLALLLLVLLPLAACKKDAPAAVDATQPGSAATAPAAQQASVQDAATSAAAEAAMRAAEEAAAKAPPPVAGVDYVEIPNGQPFDTTDGRIEIAEVTQQRRHGLRPRCRQRVLDPDLVRHRDPAGAQGRQARDGGVPGRAARRARGRARRRRHAGRVQHVGDQPQRDGRARARAGRRARRQVPVAARVTAIVRRDRGGIARRERSARRPTAVRRAARVPVMR